MSDETTNQLGSLLNAVISVRDEVALGGRALYRSWGVRITRAAFAAGALNFEHYLVLRRFDLHELQYRLMVLAFRRSDAARAAS